MRIAYLVTHDGERRPVRVGREQLLALLLLHRLQRDAARCGHQLAAVDRAGGGDGRRDRGRRVHPVAATVPGRRVVLLLRRRLLVGVAGVLVRVRVRRARL